MLTFAATLSLAIGVVLGMLGGGGAILMLPMLVYAVGVEPKTAIAMSLFVVGGTSLVGTGMHARAGNVRWKAGGIFGITAMAGAFGGGRLAHLIPANALLVLFGIMMVVTAVAMLRNRKPAPEGLYSLRLGRMLSLGAVVGLLSGLVGAGGGFLIVPALVLFGGLPMRESIGTSLFVIALQSFAGFAGHAAYVSLDWTLVLGVTAAAGVGSLVGARIGRLVSPARLRRAFAWLVIAMGLFVFAKQLNLHMGTMNIFTLLPALIGGALIGVASSLVLLTHGKIAGISGIYGGLVRRGTSDRGFRIAFIAGLVVTGALVHALFPGAFATNWSAALPVVLAAGLLVGFGTQLGNGCTSGHGVCGVARLSVRSLVATATFMASGMATVFVVRHLIGGGT